MKMRMMRNEKTKKEGKYFGDINEIFKIDYFHNTTKLGTTQNKLS